MSRLVVAEGISFVFSPKGLVASHPGWGCNVHLSYSFVVLLSAYASSATADDAYDACRASGCSRQAFQYATDQLVNAQILVDVDSLGDHLPPSPWNYWGHETWRFHQLAKSVRFMDDENEMWFTKVARDGPSPVARRALGEGIQISMKENHGLGQLADVYGRRETCREFAPRSISFPTFCEIVSEVFRVRKMVDADYFGMLPRKSFPSAGARHEIEIAAVVWNVDGIPGGLYWYDSANDVLDGTGRSVTTAEFEQMTAAQGMSRNAVASVVVFCDAPRVAWKYRSPRGYLDLYVNAGHAIQNLLLYAANCGIGAWMTTALDSDSVLRACKAPADFLPIAAVTIGFPGE